MPLEADLTPNRAINTLWDRVAWNIGLNQLLGGSNGILNSRYKGDMMAIKINGQWTYGYPDSNTVFFEALHDRLSMDPTRDFSHKNPLDSVTYDQAIDLLDGGYITDKEYDGYLIAWRNSVIRFSDLAIVYQENQKSLNFDSIREYECK